MALNSFSGVSGAILESLERDLSPTARLIANDFSPFLSELMSRPVPMLSTKKEWHDYKLAVRTVNHAAGTQDTTGDSTIVLASGHGARVRVGDILAVDGAQERILVTAVATDTLTVTRKYGGTVGATIASGATFTILGNASLEGADFSDTGTHTPIVNFNYSQIFQQGFKVSGTLRALTTATNFEGIRNEVEREANMHLREQVQALARTVISGVAPASTTQGSASVRRSMNGLDEILREGAAAGNGAIHSNISAADFNSSDAHANLNTLIKSAWDGGGRPDTILVNSRIKKQLSLNKLNARIDYNAGVVSQQVQMFETDFGNFRLLLDPQVPADRIYLVRMPDIHLLQLRPFQTEVMGLKGDYVELNMVGEFSLMVDNGSTGGHLAGYGAAA